MSFSKQVLSSHFSADQLRLLSAAHIGIAGAGGLGSNCALLLVRSGITNLTIADPDRVEYSNLNRQSYWQKHVGLPKVKALSDILLELNPDLHLNLYEQRLDAHSARTIFAECPIVVEAVDTAQTKKMLVESLMGAGHFVVSASGMAGWGGKPMQTRQMGSHLTLVGDFCSEVDATHPPLAPRVVIAAALEADAVLCQILESELR